MKRFAVLIVAALVALVAVPATAQAAEPERTVFPVESAFVFPCGDFDLAVETVGTSTSTTFFDNEGNEVRTQAAVNLTSVQTRTDTGETVTVKLLSTLEFDAITGGVTATGLTAGVFIAGQRPVYLDVGREVSDEFGEPVFQAGQDEDGSLFDFVCSTLA